MKLINGKNIENKINKFKFLLQISVYLLIWYLFATIFENSTQAARRGRQYQFATQKKTVDFI
jgi:hypothetical protein